MKDQYLPLIRKQFKQYKELGEKAIAQVPDDRLFWQANEDSNSIAVIVKHLWGNMHSRWTDFLTTDGDKPWRLRDEEFEQDLQNRSELMKRWEEGWKCLFDAIDPLTAEDLEKTVTIRAEPHSVMDALNRQLAHYAYHTGQIVYLSKMLKEGEWKSLSIPKGKSEEYKIEQIRKKAEDKGIPNG